MKGLILNLLPSAVVIAVMVMLDYDPRILVLALLTLEVYRFIAIKILYQWHRHSSNQGKAFIEDKLSSMPPEDLESMPLWQREKTTPYDFLTCIGAFVVFGWPFIVPMLYINADKEITVPFSVFMSHLTSGAWLAAIYLIGDLALRTIFIDFSENETTNLGYNVVGVGSVILAALPAAIVVSVSQGSGNDPNRWVIFGILLVIRHWVESTFLNKPRRPRRQTDIPE